MMSLRSSARVAALGLLAAAAFGCASAVDLDDVRRDQREMSRRLADTRADLESVKNQMSRLRGAIEDSRHGGSNGGPGLSELEQRIQALEQARAPFAEPVPPGTETESGAPPNAPAAPASPPSGGPAASTRSEPSAGGEEPLRSANLERDLARSGANEYRQGLEAYQRTDYGKAIQALRSFVNKNSKSELVPSAHYWIGESYYAQRKFNEAILAYNEILVGSPKSDRVPAALLRQGMAFAELGDKIDARLILQKLTAEHPGTEEAARAKQRLLALGT